MVEYAAAEQRASDGQRLFGRPEARALQRSRSAKRIATRPSASPSSRLTSIDPLRRSRKQFPNRENA